MTKISSFFSFKGGTGRSMALANTAVALAQRGRRVLCIDLDVEAPGLFSIFGLNDYTGPTSLQLLLRPDPRAVFSSVINVKEQNRWDFPGELLLLPALHEPIEVLKRAVWSDPSLYDFREKVVVPLIFQHRLDHVLIDARSGLTNEAMLCLLLSNHRIVVCLRLDRQSRRGTQFAARLFEEGIPVPQVRVASNVPSTDRALQVLAELQRDVGAVDVILPLEPDLLIEEEVLAMTRPQSALAHGYTELAALLDGEETAHG